MTKKITKWEPEDFELEMTTHWSFPKRGDWATHDAKWRGNWSPYIPRNILLRYSREGELVLDQFAGGGTTLVEAKLLNRNIIGVDVNDAALARCREKIAFEHEGADGKVYIRKGDARELGFIPDDSIDLICTHPPYADIIKYSEDIEADLSRLKVKDFLEQIEYLFNMTFVVNNKNRTVALIFNNRFWDGSHTVHISPVEDVYETEIDEEPDQEDMADSNVSYNLNDNEFWKTACLDDVVKESAKYEHIPADYTVSASQGDRISAWFNEDGGANRRIDTIWIDDLDGRQYLYIQLEDVDGDGRPDSHIELVDDFANLEREDSAPDVELKVSPATLTSVSKLRVPGEGNTPDRTPTNFLLPAVNEGTDIDETTDTETSGIISLGNLIYNGEPAKDTNSTLTLAFYTGMYRITIGGSHHYYPIAYIDDHRMLELLESLKDRAEVVEGTGIANHTLRLATLDKLFYQSTYDIDYKHAVKLTSHDPNLYDPRYIPVI